MFINGTEGMVKRSSVIISLGLLAPISAYAVGLGSIKVLSNLNEPLHAEIPLTSVGGLPLSQIKVSIADEKAYERAKIDKSYFLSKISFSIQKVKGRPTIILKTAERVENPFLQIIVDVTWAKGQFYRAYTVLLDPPGYKLEKIKVHYQQKESSLNKSPRYIKPKLAIKPQYQAVYGPTVASDDIWVIANKYHTPEVTLNQVMMAIYLANPDAFIHGNINRLRLGKKIKIPTDAAIKNINAQKAATEFSRHNKAWHEKDLNFKSNLTDKDLYPVVKIKDSDEKIDDELDGKAKEDISKMPDASPEFTLANKQSVDDAVNEKEQALKNDEKEVEVKQVVSSNQVPQTSENQDVAIHPIVEMLLKRAEEINKKSDNSEKVKGSANSSDNDLAKKAIFEVSQGNSLMQTEIASLKEQNELLKQALLTEKSALDKTNQDIKKLNAKVFQYFERNDKGELILKEELGGKSSFIMDFYPLLIALAVLAIIGNIIIYMLYLSQKKAIALEKNTAKAKEIEEKAKVVKSTEKTVETEKTVTNPKPLAEKAKKKVAKKPEKKIEVKEKTVKKAKPKKLEKADSNTSIVNEKIADNAKDNKNKEVTKIGDETTKPVTNKNDLDKQPKDNISSDILDFEPIKVAEKAPEEKVTAPMVENEKVIEKDNSLEFNLSEDEKLKTDTDLIDADEKTKTVAASDDEDDNLLDFNVDSILEDKKPVSTKIEASADDVDENLLEFDISGMESAKVEKASEEPKGSTDATLLEEDDNKVDCETKLALAETYIAMQDIEMAKETLESVIKDGSLEEQQKAKEMLSKL